MHNVDDCPVKLQEEMETLVKETGGIIKGKSRLPPQPRVKNVIQQAAKVKRTVREEPKIPKQVPKPEVKPTTEETYTQGDEDEDTGPDATDRLFQKGEFDNEGKGDAAGKWSTRADGGRW